MDRRRCSWPAVNDDEVAWVTAAEMVEVDRIMIDELHIGLIQMMENAGRNLARLTVSLFEPEAVVVYAGPGGNGGGGLVAARHLANMGVATSVVLSRPPERFTPTAAHQLDIVGRMGIEIDAGLPPPGVASGAASGAPSTAPSGVVSGVASGAPSGAASGAASDALSTAPSGAPPTAAVAVDAIIGYSLRGPLTGRATELAAAVDRHDAVVALDVPSGIDPTTGEAPGVAVTADATLTLALPKRGLRGAPGVGRLFVGDISVPPAVYRRIDVTGPLPPFERAPIVEIVSTPDPRRSP